MQRMKETGQAPHYIKIEAESGITLKGGWMAVRENVINLCKLNASSALNIH
jgi:hypothetical protein